MIDSTIMINRTAPLGSDARQRLARHPWKEGPFRALQSFSLPNPDHPLFRYEPRTYFKRGDLIMLDGWEHVSAQELIMLGYMAAINNGDLLRMR